MFGGQKPEYPQLEPGADDAITRSGISSGISFLSFSIWVDHMLVNRIEAWVGWEEDVDVGLLTEGLKLKSLQNN